MDDRQTKEKRDAMRERVGVEFYADGTSYYYGLRPVEIVALLDECDALEGDLHRESIAVVSAQQEANEREVERDQALDRIDVLEAELARIRETAQQSSLVLSTSRDETMRERDEARQQAEELSELLAGILPEAEQDARRAERYRRERDEARAAVMLAEMAREKVERERDEARADAHSERDEWRAVADTLERERDAALARLGAIRRALDTEATMDDPRTPRERVINILEGDDE